ncbi:ras and Rab interactor 1 [Spea bombifrons]|uniref:ras and Rab interactor 1 n=1 Tax=Spea bombifrons TaxID=233779 RepID=UPI00234A3AE8|nr:ras and Rab interactor 1 [Spea bombifrons]
MDTVSDHCTGGNNIVEPEPVYDYPHKESSCSPSPRGSPTSIGITDRLLLTQTVWFHPRVNSATALHILQREPPGTFLVRKSSTRQRMVLCVRLSDDRGPSFVHQTNIHESSAGVYLEQSTLTFPDLVRLVSYNISERDVLPYALRLPAAIEKVTSQKQLEAISHLGLEFWNSSLNARDPSGVSTCSYSTSALPLTPTPPDLPDPITPSILPTLKTRSPHEVSTESKEGALFFSNPLFKPKDTGALKRSHFQKSIKVRVSTENSGSLSPPLDPPPPVPTQETVAEEEEVVTTVASQEVESEQTKEASEDQGYRKPRSSLRQRLKKSFSKGSIELGLKKVPKDVGDYNVPVSVKRLPDPKDMGEHNSHDVTPLEEQDSGSVSSAEGGTSEDGGKFSPQLTRRKKKRNGRSSFRAVSGAFLSLLSPERKILMFIEEMGRDVTHEFGKELKAFLRNVEESRSVAKNKETEVGEGSHKTLLTEVREFMNKMKNVLKGSTELELHVLSSEDEDRILEKALHRLILKPLKSHLVNEIQKGMEENGELERLGKNMQAVQRGGPTLLGVSLGSPTIQDLERIRHKLLRMQEKYSPCDKVRLLLQACRGVYRSMDSLQDDACGADEFLPALCYVLALCNMPQLLIHTHYTTELLPQDTLMGEGGYYLTSLSAALSVLSSLHTHPQDTGLSLREWHRRRQGLPSLNDLQNFLRVAHQDPMNGCTTKTILLRPSQTVADLSHLCALKFKPMVPEEYVIILHSGEDQQILSPDSRPQEIKAKLKETGSSFYFCYQRVEDCKEEELTKDVPQDL